MTPPMRRRKLQKKEKQYARQEKVIVGDDIVCGIDDLLMEILVNLPAMSLVRFQVVSKQWRSLISDESFRGRHHRQNRNRQVSFILNRAKQHFLCDLSEKSLILVPLHLHPDWKHVKILQSSNGLLLLDCRKLPYGERTINVYNPITPEQRPRKIRLLEANNSSRFFLVYNPSKSPHYRVFMIYATNRKFSVYDSRTHKWEDHNHQNPLMDRFPSGAAVLNDRLYFIRYSSDSLCLSSSEDGGMIMSTVSNPPRSRHAERRKRYVIESNGHLHCLVLSFVKKTCWCECFLDVYEMIDHTTWVRWEDRISVVFHVESIEMIEVLGFVRGERKEDSTVVYHVPGKIMSYRFGDHNVIEEIVADISKDISLCDDKDSLQIRFMDTFSFFQSLLPVV